MTDRPNPLVALFSKEEEPVVETPAVEEPIEAVVEPVEEPAPAGEAVVEEDEDSIPEGDNVPTSVLVAERAKWKERLRAAKANKEATPPPAAATPEPATEEAIPDPEENPREYAAFMERQVEIRILNERTNFSERLAVIQHSQEVVDKAFEWASAQMKADKAFGQKVITHQDPYGFMVEQFNKAERIKALEGVEQTELEAFRAWKKAQGTASEPGKTAAPPAKAGTKTPAKVAKKAVAPPPEEEDEDEMPPSSLASEQSATGKDPVVDGVGAGKAFKSLFS